ncbi:MAG TPA: DNA cytosine methyltransferase [Nocardioides sp.]
MSFEYCDLFAGIGGFHAALDSLGGHCAFASEIDPAAAAVYERNWGPGVTRRDGRPVVEGDIVALTDPSVADHLPAHDVLVGGFPCQPFSKSGYQRGINETRGTLFFNIAQILRERQPSIVFLENVRNLVGPRHESTWRTIISTLRSLGYRVSDTPTVFSPHLLPQECGGSPQVRERVFILGTYVGVDRAQAETSIGPVVPKGPVDGWNPQAWDLNAILTSQGEVLESGEVVDLEPYALSVAELGWIAVWDEFVQEYYEAAEGASLPGFPIWADEFRSEPRWTPGMPKWKRDFLQKNSDLYNRFRHSFIDDWLQRHDHLAALPPSRRKLEWQAQSTGSLWDTVLHLRPSGIRAKRPTYVPALVAMNQTSIIGSQRRRITPREAARLQGLPDWFDFGDQPDALTYKQLGNGVAVGAAYHVFREHVMSDSDVAPHIRDAVAAGPSAPSVRRPLASAV